MVLDDNNPLKPYAGARKARKQTPLDVLGLISDKKATSRSFEGSLGDAFMSVLGAIVSDARTGKPTKLLGPGSQTLMDNFKPIKDRPQPQKVTNGRP